MAKPSMIIDVLTTGPKDDEGDEGDDELPLEDDEAPKADPVETIRSIEAQLSALRRQIGGAR